jgi:hypothetical protein
MKTGIGSAIFLATVVFTLALYYIKYGRKEDPIEFLENNSLLITILLAFFVFTVALVFGFKIVLLSLAFMLLFFLLLINR